MQHVRSSLQHVGSFFFLVAARRLLSCGMHAGSSSPTRDRTRAPCIGSTEAYPLDHQGSPRHTLINYICVGLFPGSRFCHIDLCVCFCANTILWFFSSASKIFLITRQDLGLVFVATADPSTLTRSNFWPLEHT